MPDATRPVQLLQAWNPLTEPLTVKVHVDGLLRGSGDRRVWFGRIYAGRLPEALTVEGARKKWPLVAQVADDMERTGRELLLLATNFQSLHAMRVDRIAFGVDGAREDASHVPRLLPGPRRSPSGSASGTSSPSLTSRWRRSPGWRTTPAWSRRAVPGPSPSGSTHTGRSTIGTPSLCGPCRWPRSSTTANSAPRSTESRLFAAQPGTVFPPNLDVARETLRAEMDPPWSLLEEPSRLYLASSTLVESLQREGSAARYGMEPSAALILLSKAVETECRAVLQLLQGITRGAAPWRTTGHLSTLTLGDIGPLFRGLLPSLPAPRLPVTLNLLRNQEWSDWLGEFGRARNRAAHAEPLPLAELRRHRDLILVRNRSRLAPLCHAKREMQNAAGT